MRQRVFLYAFSTAFPGRYSIQRVPDEPLSAAQLKALPQTGYCWELTGTTRARKSLNELAQEFYTMLRDGTLPPSNMGKR